MLYLEVFNAVGSELFKSVTGKLFTDAQIKAVTSHAVGKYFTEFLPEPKDERAARERVDDARNHIAKATQIINALQAELGSQTQQLDSVLKELEEKKLLAHKYGELAKTSQEQFAAFKSEMEAILRQELLTQSNKGKGIRQVASAVIWVITLVLGAALGTYFKDVLAWVSTIAA